LQAAVTMSDLTKRFGEFTSVDHVSLEIMEGEIFGLIGPNGAGKTTLIRMLTTLYPPTSGKATVAGFDILREPDSVRASIGVLPQAMTLDNELTAWENMNIYAKYYHVPPQIREERIRELLKMVGLLERADYRVARFSGGMKRRLELVRSLIHRPRVLFLDEPTTGLDPQARNAVWDYLRKLRDEEKTTLVITTHFLDEAETLCDRVAIIDYGKVIAIGTSAELKRAATGGDVIEASFSSLGEDILDALEKLPIIRKVTKSQAGLTLLVENGAEALPRIVESVNASGGKIKSMTMREPTLDDVFLHFTGRSIREDTRIGRRRFIGMRGSFTR